jgi:hypothetical protein
MAMKTKPPRGAVDSLGAWIRRLEHVIPASFLTFCRPWLEEMFVWVSAHYADVVETVDRLILLHLVLRLVQIDAC